jgi:hypothetical protein
VSLPEPTPFLPGPLPTAEDLLVLYVNGEVDQNLVRRLVEAGGTRVASRNPYWDHWGVTIADPDGYRLVLSSLSWSEKPSDDPT